MKNLKSPYISLLLVFLCFCSSKNINNYRNRLTFEDLERATPNKILGITYTSSEQKIEEKIRIFEKRLRTEKPLSKDTWLLHDELLADYIRLKSRATISGTNLQIPPQSRITVDFTSFCLNANKASPDDNEFYTWKHESTKIPYFSEIIKYLSTHKNVKQSDIQSLLWNLQQGTNFEDYPDHQKAILREIDPNANLKLPSRTKSRSKSKIRSFIQDYIPGANEVENVIDEYKSTYRSYKDIADDIQSLRSKEPLDNSGQPQVIIPNQLYADTKSDGYSNQTVIFYNPTHQTANLDTSHLYLQPKRNDVQRIGLFPKPLPISNSNLISKLEKVLFGDMLRLGIGFVPIANDIADAYEVVTGKDAVSGDSLTTKERLFSALGLAIGNGAGYRYLNRFANAPVEYVDDFERQLSHGSGHAVNNVNQNSFLSTANEAKELIKSGEIGSAAQIAITDLKSAFRSSNITPMEESFVKAMDPSTLRKEIATANTPNVQRYYGGDSPEYSNWLMESGIHGNKSEIKEAFQLPNSNTMEHLSIFRIKEGTIFYSSKVDHGTARQIFIFNPEKNLSKVE